MMRYDNFNGHPVQSSSCPTDACPGFGTTGAGPSIIVLMLPRLNVGHSERWRSTIRRAVESVDGVSGPRWVILESAWPPPFSRGVRGMPQERLSMRKFREVLRLKADGFSKRRIAASLGISAISAMECVQGRRDRA